MFSPILLSNDMGFTPSPLKYFYQRKSLSEMPTPKKNDSWKSAGLSIDSFEKILKREDAKTRREQENLIPI